jgi:2-desacetyl-2-hydroxyethyl bacteriochlorophyllide A dehydrogenase
MKTMKAFVKVKPEYGGTQYQDVEIPKIGPDQVLIEVKAAGLCGTDIHVYDWADNIVKEYKPVLPRIMGHEFSGIVADRGADVSDIEVGARVTVLPVLYCGKCYYCRTGKQNICNNRPILGIGANGAFAQYAAVRAKNVYRLSDDIPFEIAALSELSAVALHAIDRIGLTLGDTVVAVGAGPVGLMMAIMAKHAGAGRIFVTGLEADAERLEVARQLGAIPICVEREDPKSVVFGLTDGLGADVVFETAGVAAGVIQSINLVRKGGRVSILGQGHQATEISTAVLSFREIELVGTRAYTTRDWNRISVVLHNAQGDLEKLISHRLPLEMTEKGIELMKMKKGLKIIVCPDNV